METWRFRLPDTQIDDTNVEDPVENQKEEEVDPSLLIDTKEDGEGGTYRVTRGGLILDEEETPEEEDGDESSATEEEVTPDSEEEEGEQEEDEPPTPEEKPKPPKEEPPRVPPEASDEQELPKWKGWSLHPTGLALFEMAMEDPDSDEAILLINGEYDEEGNKVKEGIGQREYDRAYQRYLLAKKSYDEDLKAKAQAKVREGASKFSSDYDTLVSNVKTWINSEEELEDLGPLEIFAEEATALVENQRRARAKYYHEDYGLEPERASMYADADVLGTDNLYLRAVVSVIAEKLAAEILSGKPGEVAQLLGMGKVSAKPADKPQKPVDEPPGVSGTTTTSGSKKNPYVGIPKEVLEMARATGVDPRKLMEMDD